MKRLVIQLGITCLFASCLTPMTIAQSPVPQHWSSPVLAPDSPPITGANVPALPPLSVQGQSALMNRYRTQLAEESVLAPPALVGQTQIRPVAQGNIPPSAHQRQHRSPVSLQPNRNPANTHAQGYDPAANLRYQPNTPRGNTASILLPTENEVAGNEAVGKMASPERYLPPQDVEPIPAHYASPQPQQTVMPYGTNPYANRTASREAPSQIRQASATMSGWGYPQDGEGNLPEPNRNASGLVDQLPRPLSATQDPESDPVLPGGQLDDPVLNQQETDPRPLPGDTRPPTELPVLPTDPNGNSSNNPNLLPGDGREPFVFPREYYPGKQTYPGSTAGNERPQPQSEPKRTNPSQVLYGPARKPEVQLPPNSNPAMAGQGGWPVAPVEQGYQYPYGNVVQQPVSPVNPIYSAPVDPAVQGEYRSVVAPSYAQPYDPSCESPEGWRPQMVQPAAGISIDPCDPCFEPMFYLSAFGGFHSPDDLVGSLIPTFSLSNSFQLDRGATFGLALGQYQGRNLRTEFEYTYRHSDADQIQLHNLVGVTPFATEFGIGGELKAHSGMGNLIWQFTNVPSQWVKPYVGAGIGFVFTDADLQRGGNSILVDGSSGNSSFAYQFIAGINTQLSRELDVFVEYRYFAADELRLETNLVNVQGGVGSQTTIDERFDFDANSVNFGVRFKF